MMIKDFKSDQLRGETRLRERLGKEGDQELEAGGKPWWIEMYGYTDDFIQNKAGIGRYVGDGGDSLNKPVGMPMQE